MSSQSECKAITKAGTRCTRTATIEGYCKQHYNIYIKQSIEQNKETSIQYQPINTLPKQNLDISVSSDIMENIISDYIDFNELKELEQNFNNFKINPKRIEVTEEIENGHKYIETYIDDELVKSVSFYSNGNRWSERNYKNEEYDGIQTIYYSNGKLANIENYKNGIKEGKTYNYNIDGKLLEEINYKNGKPEKIKKYKSGIKIKN
jgi:antitoxin component YwqK of YwqJK toxin-antitoxin module